VIANLAQRSAMEAQFGYSELLEGMPVSVATASTFFKKS
jgi:hypothetical protein